MKIRFISDLHLGHKSICDFSGEYRGNCTTVEEHDQWIEEQWNSVVNKRDLVWVLGDVAFSKDAIKRLKKMRGSKHLIIGNHDRFPLALYLEYFNKIHGFLKYKGFWLSHPPIHPNELRGKQNISGHTHSTPINDSRYFSVSAEMCAGKPIDLETVRMIMESKSQ